MGISASIFAADFTNLESEINNVSSIVDSIHFDVMDGVFVENFALSPCILKAIKRITDLPISVHLMVVDPARYIKMFCDAGASLIYVHYESRVDIRNTLHRIKSLGMRTGVAVKPETQLDQIEELSDLIDSLLIMTVNPGFCGQKFMVEMEPKILQAREIFKKSEIVVDGGIDWDIMQTIRADTYVMGSALFNGRKYERSI